MVPQQLYICVCTNMSIELLFLFSSQVGVDHQTISMIYSVRAVGTVFSSLLVGYVFDTKFFKQKEGTGSLRKLVILAICHSLIAACLLNIPFITEFSTLVVGMLNTCMIYIYIYIYIYIIIWICKDKNHKEIQIKHCHLSLQNV